jgi:hypothetical protein
MTKKYHTSTSASAAIAAVLALTPAAALAQVVDLPVVTAAPAAPAAVTLPESIASSPAPAPSPIVIPADLPPVATAEPAASATAARAPTAVPAARAAATPPQADRAPPTPSDASSTALASNAAAPANRTVTPAPSEDAALPPVAAPAPPSTAERAAPLPVQADGSSTSYWALALGGMAALGLAVWGFVAIGRRKPLERRTASERVGVAEPLAEPVALGSQAQPAASASMFDLRRPSGSATENLAHSGASVALPRVMPQRFEDRDALLKRMIAAKPDRANPFTSYGARRKRARLILQSLGQDFEGREPWIDLGQYSANWPELARRRNAAA